MGELETRLASAGPVLKEQLLSELAGRVITPYLAMAGVLLALAYLVRRSGLPEISLHPAAAGGVGAATAPEAGSIGQFPHLLLGVGALFCAVGVEVIAGDTIIQYGRAQGISLDVARNFTSLTLTAMIIGLLRRHRR